MIESDVRAALAEVVARDEPAPVDRWPAVARRVRGHRLRRYTQFGATACAVVAVAVAVPLAIVPALRSNAPAVQEAGSLSSWPGRGNAAGRTELTSAAVRHWVADGRSAVTPLYAAVDGRGAFVVLTGLDGEGHRHVAALMSPAPSGQHWDFATQADTTLPARTPIDQVSFAAWVRPRDARGEVNAAPGSTTRSTQNGTATPHNATESEPVAVRIVIVAAPETTSAAVAVPGGPRIDITSAGDGVFDGQTDRIIDTAAHIALVRDGTSHDAGRVTAAFASSEP